MYGIDDILTFYNLYNAVVETLDTIDSIRDNREMGVESLKKSIDDSSVKFGDNISIKGTFSDFVPIARGLVYETEEPGSGLFIDALACRPFTLKDYHCGSLHGPNSQYAGDPGAIPVFYEHDTARPISDYLTGERVIIDGKLISLPSEWKRFLDLESPIGIHANRIREVEDPRDEFGIVFWKIVRDSGDLSMDVGSGMLFAAQDHVWMAASRVDKNRVLVLHAWNHEERHGDVDESAENVLELYRTNFLDDGLVESQISHLSARMEDYPIDVSWDMQDESNYDWLRSQLQ